MKTAYVILKVSIEIYVILKINSQFTLRYKTLTFIMIIFPFLDILVYLLESCNEAIQQRSPYTESLSAEVLQSLECEEKEFCKVCYTIIQD